MDMQSLVNYLRTWVAVIPGAVLLMYSPISLSSPRQSYRITDVPFIRQERNNCGPAALAMVLGYYRVRIGQDELAEEIRPERIGGTLNLDLLLAARNHGFDASMPAGGLATVKDYLRRDIPVIALIETSPGSQRFHYLVIYGYDDRNAALLVHSGRNRALTLPYQQFLPSWEAAENWMLVIGRRDYTQDD